MNIGALATSIVERLEEHLHAALFTGAIQLGKTHVIADEQSAGETLNFESDKPPARAIVFEIAARAETLVITGNAFPLRRDLHQGIADIVVSDAMIRPVDQADAHFQSEL